MLYSRPYAKRLTSRDVKELADAIGRPPHRWTPERLWEAYETLSTSKVRGSAGTVLTTSSLSCGSPSARTKSWHRSRSRSPQFDGWLVQQQNAGREFTDEQVEWLCLIHDHLAASLSIEPRELTDPPFSQHGGLGRARELFGQDPRRSPCRADRDGRGVRHLPLGWERVPLAPR